MDIRQSPWCDVIRDIDSQSSHYLATAFQSAAMKCKVDERLEHYRALALLAGICTMVLNGEVFAEPFQPMFSGAGSRTMLPEDLSDEETLALETLLPDISHHCLRARVAEVLWVRLRRKEYALKALDSYAAITRQSTLNRWEALTIKQRALRLARAFDREAWKAFIDTYTHNFIHCATLTLWEKLDLYVLIRGFHASSPQREEINETLISLGDAALNGMLWIEARQCFVSARNDYRSQRRQTDVDLLTHRIADSYLLEQRHLDHEQGLSLVHDSIVRGALAELTNLSRVYRNAHGLDQQIERLRIELGRYGHEIVTTMEVLSSDRTDITDMVRQTEGSLTGLGWMEALAEYAKLGDQLDVEAIRTHARQLIMEFPLRHMLGRKTFSRDGRLIAKSPSMDFSCHETLEMIVAKEAAKEFGLYLGIGVEAIIRPGLSVLQHEHHLSLEVCRWLAARAVPIPSDRVEGWARGIYHGLQGSIVEAVHLLIPQVEHWLRWLLQTSGADTINREKGGQDVHITLETILVHPQTREMLDESLWFELSFYFLDPQGANLRNELCHGLIADEDMESTPFFSFWYLCFRLIMLNQAHHNKALHA